MTDDSKRFHVWTDGDPSVGIWGSSATVDVWVGDDAEYEAHVRETLAKAFEHIWDFPARVLSEQELAEEAEGEQLDAEWEAHWEQWQREGYERT